MNLSKLYRNYKACMSERFNGVYKNIQDNFCRRIPYMPSLAQLLNTVVEQAVLNVYRFFMSLFVMKT